MASKTLASLILRIGADVTGAVKGLSTTQRASRALQKEFTGLDKATIRLRSSMVALGAAGALGMIIRESVETQRTTAQLASVIKSTGGVAGWTVGQIEDLAQSLQKTTIYSNEATKGAASLLLTFKTIRGEEFKRALISVEDLAQALAASNGGTPDLKSAALQVGKALEDPATQMTYLRRSGISFSQAQIDLAKKLEKTGDLAGAQAIVLKELEAEFGGSAKAARQTLGGALDYLKNQFTDFFKVSAQNSGVLTEAINSVGDAIPWVRQQMAAFLKETMVLGSDAAVEVGKLKLGFADLREWFTENAANIPGLGRLVPEGAVQDAMRAAGQARDQLRFLKQARDEVIQGIVAPRIPSAPTTTSTSLTPPPESLAAQARSVLAAGISNRAPFNFGITPDSVERINAARKRVQMAQDAIANGWITMPKDIKPIEKEIANLGDVNSVTMSRMAQQVDEARRIFRSMAGDIGYEMDAAFESIIRGTRNIVDAVRTMVTDILAEFARLEFEKHVVGPFVSWLDAALSAGGAAAGGSTTNYTGGTSASRAGAPGFATGNAVVVHQTLNQTVNALDAPGVATLLRQNKGEILKMVSEGVRESTTFRRAVRGS